MRLCIIFASLVLVACDNKLPSSMQNHSLFETSEGVVYLLNQTSGDLEVVSPKQTVIVRKGEVFSDGEGRFFRHLGDGITENVDPIDSLVEKYRD